MRILLIGTIFLSAFLLFLVQPIIAKQITPWFGGTSSTWATCMMFFQVTLLLGYTYSDFVVRRMQPKMQSLLHIGFLLTALVMLPIIPNEIWKPAGDTEPTLQVLALLLFTVGLPYFMLSTTGPLLQAWYSRRFPGTGVYRLFALSNLASLGALVSYPFVIEPYFTTVQQSWGWSIGFALFALSCVLSAWKGRHDTAISTVPDTTPPTEAETGHQPAPPHSSDYFVWLSLAALGSMLLLSITNHITQNVASVPFLWLLPLTVYLLTFILCFDGNGWYRRSFFIGPLLVLLVTMASELCTSASQADIRLSVPLFTIGLFVCCMFFHGELANRKPAPRYLTRFYLMISLGGALGSIFVSAIAPYIFSNYFELPIALVATSVLLLFLLRHYLTATRTAYGILMMVMFSTVCTVYFGAKYYQKANKDNVLMLRNFYGTLRVTLQNPGIKEFEIRELLSGTILHGRQFVANEKRNQPTSYFGESSGPGYALKKMGSRPMNVGVVGLGIGTVALYGKKGDYFRFYEINPHDKRIAQDYFWYLHDSPAKTEVILGDGRLSLEQELKEGKPGEFDILMLDAFTGDSAPVHLLTKEALNIYRRHIKPDGVIIFNTSNLFLNIPPVIQKVADEIGMQTVKYVDFPEGHLLASDWVFVTNNQNIVDDLKLQRGFTSIAPIPGLKAWTDDYSNLFKILIKK